MKDRSQTLAKAQISLAAIGFALTLALGGCSGNGSASSSGSGADSSQSGSFGGSGRGTAANGRHRMAEALMSLGLSDAQKSQIREIMGTARKESANADPATRRANFKAAFAKIDAVLTPDQRTKLHAKLGQMRNARQQGAQTQS